MRSRCGAVWIAVGAAVLLTAHGRALTPPLDGQAQHEGHQMASRLETAIEGEVAITRVTRAPDHFVGNVTYDAATARLWLVSYGPPANTVGPSTLYEVEPDTGKVLAATALPFRGELATAAYVKGLLYQVVAHESTVYTIATEPRETLGRIAGKFPLPTHIALKPADDDVYRFPFVAFTAGTATADGHVLLYAADRGELMTLDVARNAITARVRTAKGLAGVSAVPDSAGRPLLLATFDPVDAAFRQETRRFMFRASHGILPLETVRAEGNYGNPGQKTVTWVLVDPRTGEVLASTPMESSRVEVGSVACIRRDAVPGTRYGRLIAITVGDEGLLTVEWTPR